MKLPNGANDFSADIFQFCFPITQHTAIGVQNANAQSVKHWFEIIRSSIDPATRFADTFDMVDDLFAIRTIFQMDSEHRHRFYVRSFPVPNVSFTFQNVGDSLFFNGKGHFDGGFFNADSIPYSGQHVGYRIGHHNCCLSKILLSRYSGFIYKCLPTCLFDTGNVSLIGEVTEADSADTELTVDRSRTTAELASVFGTGRKFRFLLCFQSFCFTCHCLFPRGPSRTISLVYTQF